jgi:hypothetical protein
MKRRMNFERLAPPAVVEQQNALRQKYDDELMARMGGSKADPVRADAHEQIDEARPSNYAPRVPAAPNGASGAGYETPRRSEPERSAAASIRSTTTPEGMTRAPRGVAAEAAGTEHRSANGAAKTVPARGGMSRSWSRHRIVAPPADARPIPGFGKYAIERDGTVHGPTGKLSTSIWKGSTRVQMHNDRGGYTSRTIARLLAEVWGAA